MAWGSYAWASSGWSGQASSAAAAVDTPYGLDLTLIVGGNDWTDHLLNDTLRITDELGSRVTCEFSLVDSDGELFPEVGEEVRITYAGSVIFRGTIDELERADVATPYFSSTIQIDVICVDWHQLCDRHVVAVRYESLGQRLVDESDASPAGVVNSIVSSDSGESGERLSDEGITVEYVSTVEYPVLGKVAFNYETVTDCFDQLAELTGYTWRVGFDKVLSFYDPTRNPAPYSLDPTLWEDYRGLKVRQTRTQYRNYQYLRGGTGTTGSRTQSFAGDDEKQSFDLALPVAAKPTLTINGTPVSAAAISIRTDEDKQPNIDWFFEIGSNTITQHTDDTPLTSAQTLAVTYLGQFPIITVARDDDQISARAAVEGGTGIYVHVEQEEKIDDVELADDRVAAMLRRYGRIPSYVEFETFTDGFRSGQLLSVNLPEHNLVGTFLIDSVAFSCVGDKLFRYAIRAVDGESDGSWVDFFKRWINKGRPYVIKDNETIRTVRHRSDTIVLGDSISFTMTLEDATDDAYTTIIVGLNGVGGQRRLRWQDADNPDAGDTGEYVGPLLGQYTSP